MDVKLIRVTFVRDAMRKSNGEDERTNGQNGKESPKKKLPFSRLMMAYQTNDEASK